MWKWLELLALVILALVAPGTTTLKGTLRGHARLGGLRIQIGQRTLALAFMEYRPGKVFYQLAVGA